MRAAVEVGGAVVLFGFAAALRLGRWEALPVGPDWGWFVRMAESMAAGTRVEAIPAFLYTSLAPWLLSLLLRVTGDFQVSLALWGLAAAAAAPLLFLALTREVGPIGALGAGVVLAAAMPHVYAGRGLNSPYIAGLPAALLVLGCLMAHRRRASGPPLLALCGALVAGFHVGLIPLAVACLALALFECRRLVARRGRIAAISAALWLAPVLALVVVDGERLLGELRLIGSGQLGGTPPPAEELFEVLGLRPSTAALLVVLLAALLVLRRLGVARPPEVADGGSARLAADGVGLAKLGLLLACGVLPFVALALGTGYVSAHHLVGAAPLALAVLLGLGARWSPRAAWLAPVVVALLLVASPLTHTVRELTAVPIGGGHQYEQLVAFADELRGATEPEAEPWIFVQPGQWDGNGAMSAILLNEFARMGLPRHPPGDTCFYVVDGIDLGALGLASAGLDPARLPPYQELRVWRDPGCATLVERGAELCALLPKGLRARTWARGPVKPEPVGEDEFPCEAIWE
jgi:hypothetical protein